MTGHHDNMTSPHLFGGSAAFSGQTLSLQPSPTRTISKLVLSAWWGQESGIKDQEKQSLQEIKKSKGNEKDKEVMRSRGERAINLFLGHPILTDCTEGAQAGEVL